MSDEIPDKEHLIKNRSTDRYIKNKHHEPISNQPEPRRHSGTSRTTQSDTIDKGAVERQKLNVLKDTRINRNLASSAASKHRESPHSNKNMIREVSHSHENKSENHFNPLEIEKRKVNVVNNQTNYPRPGIKSNTEGATTLTTSTTTTTTTTQKIETNNTLGKRSPRDTQGDSTEVKDGDIEKSDNNIKKELNKIQSVPEADYNTNSTSRISNNSTTNSKSTSKQILKNDKDVKKKVATQQNHIKPSKSVTSRHVKNTEQSYDINVDRGEYEEKGLKVADKNLNKHNNRDFPSVNGTLSKTDNYEGISKTVNKNVAVSENVTDNEIDFKNGVTSSTKVDEAIHWKELVQKHVQQPNPGVKIGESRIRTEHETETEETITGIRQWRDLVQKYLHTKNPTVGKSTDRHLLEAEDDDEDDIDVFERARRKYKLNIESDDESDDDD